MADSGVAPAEQGIVEQFQKLREQQAAIVSEISRIEEERREHARVYELVKDLNEDRTCFQLVSDSLVEMRVKDVLPKLQANISALESVRDTLNARLVEKGKELNTHKEKYNIRFVSEQEAMAIRQGQLKQQQGAAPPVKA